jgi:Nif-specific regulatory protein
MPHVVVREPGRVAYSIELRDGLRVGRHDDNDLVLDDHQVSRRHAEFTLREGRFWLSDGGSTHGTLVNGERVAERALSEGDRIQIGNVLLTFTAEALRQASVVEHATAKAPPKAVFSGAEGRRLQLVLEVARAIGSLREPAALIETMLDTILEVFDCERGVVGLVGSSSERATFARSRRGAATDIVVSQTLLDTMLSQRRSIIVRDAEDAAPMRSLVRHGVHSAMGAPLIAAGRVLGFVYVDDRARENRFSEPDLDFLGALAHLTAAAVDGAAVLERACAVAEALRDSSVAADLLGESDAMQKLRAMLHKYASASDAHVLIRGESGTGKELVARTLHALSPRADEPFVALNCAAMPDTMIESELFGFEKGAFTGAAKDKRGKFALAHRGTLFLDEIGDLSLTAQAKVLRAIEAGEVQPLGSEKTLRVDVRVLSATHKDLLAEVAAARFREDLYYRLNVVEVEVPPLRARSGDIVLLARAFLERSGQRLGKRFRGFSEEAERALGRYGWPGNVRQLQNEVERAAILAEGPRVEAGDLSARVASTASASAVATPVRDEKRPDAPPRTLAERFAELEPTEKALCQEALESARGNLSEAARLLGITRIMMKRRAERYGLRGADDDGEGGDA